VVKGRVKRLVIDRSIVGPIEVVAAAGGAVEVLLVRDSIIDAIQRPPSGGAAPVAIRNNTGEVRLLGCTVLGNVEAQLLRASDTLVLGQLTAANTQDSCFRFSAASKGGRPPRAFHAHVEAEIRPFFFTSLRFGDPGYAQLSRVAPDFVKSGAENGSELGAFSFLRNPIRLLSAIAKVDEFKPLGVLPQYVFEGEDPNGSTPGAAP
jgi:hypothetical protein